MELFVLALIAAAPAGEPDTVVPPERRAARQGIAPMWQPALICAARFGAGDCQGPQWTPPGGGATAYATEAACFAAMDNWTLAATQRRACWKFDVEP